MSDDETRQRIAMFEAAVAAYVLDSLNSHQQPELSYEGAKKTLIGLYILDVLGVP